VLFRVLVLLRLVLPLLLFQLCSCVRGFCLRVEAVRGVFVEEFSRDVGPELLENTAEGAFAGDDHAIVDGLARACCLRWVIEIGDGAGDDVAANVGVVGLPLSGVVVLADKAGGDGIEKPVLKCAVAETEVARILVQREQEGGRCRSSRHRKRRGKLRLSA
jgi:hypothetical protein